MTTATADTVTGLLEAISSPLDRNDLGRLARMHSCCQQLIEAASPSGGAVVDATTGLLAAHLLILLERLILDEATDPVAGLALVPEAVRAIEEISQGRTLDAGPLLSRMAQASGDGTRQSPRTESLAANVVPPSPQPGTQAVAPAAPELVARAAPVSPPPTATSTGPASVPVDESYVAEPLVLDLSEREHLDGFLEEASEHMDAIEGGLLEVEADPTDTTKINELFRPFHTIKGIAGFLNLRDINRLTHEIETILDLGRKNEMSITAGIVDLIFSGVDMLKAQLAAIRQYMSAPSGGPCPQPDAADVIGRLRRAARGSAAASVAASAPRPKLGEILVAEGTVTEATVRGALTQQASGGDRRKLGEILVEQGVATPGQLDKALVQQASGKPLLDQSIRVDTCKLDVLVDAVGELVIAQSMVSLASATTVDEKLLRNVSQVSKIVRDVQETAMAMRMVPIGQTFQKMRRLVRDVARKAGKTVDLVISGEDTELDKNVIQQISDPLVHMVRNAVDHGIESPADRLRLNKPDTGQVFLNAFHQGDSIVIEIRDDGRGLDREKLIAKAVERGLVNPTDELSEQQAFGLILLPGFSTAEKVTDISGRGVGMDVVKRNVEQLRGKIEIHSEKGRGSTFKIRLPLTLAIIDGMLVRLGTERMIIPTILIEQSMRPELKQITTVQRRGAMLQVRGELCPLIQLGALFGYGEPVDPCENIVVIVQCGGQKVALVVDELIGQQQVVIKTLEQRFKRVEGVSGAAILGDGRVGLILEPAGLLQLHNRRGAGTFTGRAAAPRREPTVEGTESEGNPSDAADAASRRSGAACPAEPVTAPA